MEVKDRIIVALDMPALEGLEIAYQLKDEVGGFKVGISHFVTSAFLARRIKHELGKYVLYDGKFHDIPSTMVSAARSIVAIGSDAFTVHLTSGYKALDKVCEVGQEHGIDVVGVTQLSSLPRNINRVLDLINSALLSGISKFVVPPWSVRTVRTNFKYIELFVPGIRRDKDGLDDHLDVGSPGTIIAQGADKVIIGRSVTQSEDPVATVKKVQEEISGCLIGQR